MRAKPFVHSSTHGSGRPPRRIVPHTCPLCAGAPGLPAISADARANLQLGVASGLKVINTGERGGQRVEVAGWEVQDCGSGALCTDWRQCSAAHQRCAPCFALTPSSPSSSSCPFSPAGHGTQIEWDSLSDSAATVPVSCKRLNERDERVLLDPCMCNQPALLQLHCCPQRRVVEATHRATWLRQPSNRRTAVVEHPPLLCSAQPAAPLRGHLTCRPLPLLPLLPARSPQVVDDKWHAIFDGSAEGKTVRQVPGERGAGQHWGGGSRWWV